MSNNSDFTLKKKIPSTDEYLTAPLEKVLERLNNNPNGNQSEDSFIQAVITVRNAKASEKLTLLIAIATFLLILVPFFVPTLDKKELESNFEKKDELNKKALSELSKNNESMKNELLTLKTEVTNLKNELSQVRLMR
jgi:uncharacterized protein YlxW (UPF0749 family)